MKYRQQQLELTNTNLQRQVERLSEEKEEREREAVSYFNSLEVPYLLLYPGCRVPGQSACRLTG